MRRHASVFRLGFAALLASSSAAALLIGGGTPASANECSITQDTGTVASLTNSDPNPPSAACIHVTNGAGVSGDVTNTNTGTLTGINGQHTGIIIDQGASVGGSIINSGTISNPTSLRAGIVVHDGATLLGDISNGGTISGVGRASAGPGFPAAGIAVTSVAQFGTASTGGHIINSGTISPVVGATAGILVQNVPSVGGITNSGTIAAGALYGIDVGGVVQFGTASTAGISNSGAIFARSGGIVAGVSNFAGGVTNSGTITVSDTRDAIFINASSAFTGGITNSGVISAGEYGITVNAGSFTGDFTNSGTITGGTIGADGVNLFANQYTGGFSNSGTISGFVGASVAALTFAGTISNSGTITGVRTGLAVSFQSTFTGAISNSGTISATETGINVLVPSAPISIFDSGTIIAGNGFPSIDLRQGSPGNILTLGPGYSITGVVAGQGTDTFQLGGVGAGAFDLSTIGSPGQYQGFTTFNVVSGTWTVSNTFTPPNPWTVAGGTLVITGSLGNASGVTLSGGTIVIGSNNALGAGTLAMAAGTTLSFLNTGSFTVANNITLSGDPTFVTTAPSSSPETMSGTITNATTPPVGALTVDGGGYIALTGPNTYSGGTTICGATATTACVNTNGVTPTTLIVNNSTPGTSSSIGIGTLTFDGGVLQAGANDLSFSNAVSINSTGGTIDVNGQSLTWTGAMTNGSGATPGSLIVISSTGGGTLILTPASAGANTYTGATIVGDGSNAVTLQGGTTDAFSANSAVTVNARATLDLGGYSQAIGSLAGAGTVTNSGSNNATLTAGGNNASTTFSGVIQDGSDTVALTKLGTGTLTLTGNNSYSGGTTLDAGTLQISGAGTLGATTGTLGVAGGILDLGATTQTTGGLTMTAGTIQNGTLDAASFGVQAGTISAILGGSGALTKTGAGTVILSGANTYSGGTTISAGTIEVANNTAFGSGTVTLNGGTVQAGAAGLSISNAFAVNSTNGTVDTQANTLTLSGTIGNGTGSGALSKIGSGTLILSGANTYSGGTTLSAGTLTVGNNSALGTGTLSMAAGTTLSFLSSGNFTISNNITISGDPDYTPPANTTQTISGVIADGVSPGTVNMNGAGTLVLDATNTYTGPTDVNSGTLEVDGSIATSSLTTVANGATLQGVGTVGPTTVDTGGIFAPGTTATKMTVSGSLTLQSAAIYMVSINGANAAGVHVTGTASISGATFAVTTGSTAVVGTDYLVLQSNTAISGQFSNTSVIFDGLKGTLDYAKNPDDVYLDVAFGTLAPLLPTNAPQNVLNVANAIDNYITGGGALPTNFQNIFNFTTAQLETALSQLSGQASTGAGTGTFQLVNDFFNLLSDMALGTGGGGAGGNGVTTGFTEPDDALPPDVALAYRRALKQNTQQQTPVQNFEQRWTAWGSGYGGTATYNGNAAIGSNNVAASDFGFAGGMDYHAAPDLKLGFALAGGGTNWSLAQNLGGGRSDVFQAAGYGIKHYGPLYFSAMAAFGNSWFTTNRTAALGDQLRATFDGQSYALRGEAGYRFAVLPVAGITPYAAVQTQWFHTPGYSETDLTGGGFGLTFNAQTANDTRGELGARADDLTSLDTMPLLLRARLAWAHDWASDTALGAVFQALPGSAFTVNGAAVPKNSALVSAGGQLFLTTSWSFEAKFDGEFASSAQTYAGTGTLRYTW